MHSALICSRFLHYGADELVPKEQPVLRQPEPTFDPSIAGPGTLFDCRVGHACKSTDDDLYQHFLITFGRWNEWSMCFVAWVEFSQPSTLFD